MKILTRKESGGISVHQTLRGQASSIRCIEISKREQDETSLLFSGGGEYCLVVWHLSIAQKQCVLAKKFVKRKQADCRVMSVSAIPLNRNEPVTSSLHLLILGMSNSYVEVIGYNPTTRDFTILANLSNHYGPLLCTKYIPVVHDDKILHYVITASTDGRLLFWEFSSLIEL